VVGFCVPDEVIDGLNHYRFAEPLKTGDYPPLLRDMKGDALPTFSEDEKKLLKGSTDFIA
jgi:hypothetical protein